MGFLYGQDAIDADMEAEFGFSYDDILTGVEWCCGQECCVDNYKAELRSAFEERAKLSIDEQITAKQVTDNADSFYTIAGYLAIFAFGFLVSACLLFENGEVAAWFR